MSYLIHGINRITNDFMYMFPEFDIVGFIDDSYNTDIYRGISVYKMADISNAKTDESKIIICSFNKDSEAEDLNRLGYSYGNDYLFADDFFSSLDEEEYKINPQNKGLIIWGTGKNSSYFSEYYSHFTPDFYVDTHKHGGEFYGKSVLSPEQITDWSNYYVIIAVQKDQEIVQFLAQKGLKEDQDFINSMRIISIPSEMLRATIYDRHQYKLNCETPLNHMEYLTEGEIYCCCSTFMRSIGNSFDGGIKKVWNSAKHKVVCLSVQNHTYTFCDKSMCPLLFGKESDVELPDCNKEYKPMDESPEVCAIGYDYTCNLKCKTCRNHLRVADGIESDRMMDMSKMAEEEVLPVTKFFVMAGDGEVFASPAYRHIYQSSAIKDVPFIRLLSNGTLFNEINWCELRKNTTGKIMLTASVDAAKKETYESIRLNGNFVQLKENMAFAGKLRKQGELSYFRMNFVVQKNNYMEMPDFVKWGLEIGADEVFFTRILNWGTFTKEEFKDISMFIEDGVTPKPELKEILDDPIMKEKIVDLGTIRYGHETTKDVNIHNYYMWELERKVPGLFE